MTTELLEEPVKANIVSAIRRTVAEQFEGVDLHAVEVTRDPNPFGGEMYTVKVILEDDADVVKIARERLTGLARHLCTSLEGEEDSNFPLVRMMTKSDAEFLARETR